MLRRVEWSEKVLTATSVQTSGERSGQLKVPPVGPLAVRPSKLHLDLSSCPCLLPGGEALAPRVAQPAAPGPFPRLHTYTHTLPCLAGYVFSILQVPCTN